MSKVRPLFSTLPDALREDHIYGTGWEIRWTVHDVGAAAVNRAIRALAHVDFAIRVTPLNHFPVLARELEYEHLEAQQRLSNEMKRRAAGEW